LFTCLITSTSHHEETCGGTAPPLFTSALDGGGQLDATAALPSGKEPTAPMRSWVGPKAGLDAVAVGRNPTPVVQPVSRRYTD
jgi:hypothetical protein